MAFNLSFIALRKPLLAIRIIDLYKQASAIKQDDPAADDQDYKQAIESLRALQDVNKSKN